MALILGCSAARTREMPSSEREAVAPGRETPRPDDAVPKRDDPAPTFVDGPAIEPVDPLLRWLRHDIAPAEPRPYLRLPVVLVWQDGPIPIGRAFVGVGGREPGPHAIELEIDDTGLGIPLEQQARSRCVDRRPTCPLWLEGHWGPLVAAGGSAPPEGKETFAVLAVRERVAEDAVAATTRVQVEPVD